MTGKQTGLGKGLSALIGSDANLEVLEKAEEQLTPKTNGMITLPIHKLKSGKFQPRRAFDNDNLDELADSIRANGIMQPIVVRESKDKEGVYEIVAGERRWRAAKKLKFGTVPAIIRNISDNQALELAIIENIQRVDLSPLEEAKGYKDLMDEFGYTQHKLSKTVGKSRSHIANLIRLLVLPKEVKTYIDSGEIAMGHARALLSLSTKKEMTALAKRIVNEGLNVRQVETIVKGDHPESENVNTQDVTVKSHTRAMLTKDEGVLEIEKILSKTTGLKVKIKDKGNRGNIIIQYESLADLDMVVNKFS